MKIKIFAILFSMGFFSSSYAFDNDIFYYKNIEHKGVKKIKKKTYDGWEVISFFDEKGYLLHEINFYKKEIRSDYKYDYIATDTLLEIRRIDTIEKDVNRQKKFDRYYYTSLGQCYKHRVYFSRSDSPSYWEDNFVFENNGVLVSYEEATDWQKRNDISNKIVHEYNTKKQKVRKLEIRNEIDTTFYSYEYNQSGQLTDCVQESNNNETVYSGVVVWSDEKKNKVHVHFSNFDKRGNWTKSYFITERGSVFRSERKIEYW